MWAAAASRAARGVDRDRQNRRSRQCSCLVFRHTSRRRQPRAARSVPNIRVVHNLLIWLRCAGLCAASGLSRIRKARPVCGMRDWACGLGCLGWVDAGLPAYSNSIVSDRRVWRRRMPLRSRLARAAGFASPRSTQQAATARRMSGRGRPNPDGRFPSAGLFGAGEQRVTSRETQATAEWVNGVEHRLTPRHRFDLRQVVPSSFFYPISDNLEVRD